MSGTVRFDFMHFMPYVHLPKNHKDYKSLWVDFPNKYYDPKAAMRFISAISRSSCSPTRSASTRSSSTNITTPATA